MKPSAESKKAQRAGKTPVVKRAASADAAPAAKVADTGDAANAAAAAEHELPEGNKLRVFLVGRICLVSDGERHAAVFVDTTDSDDFRRHTPLLRAGIDDVTQEGADLALVSMADDNGRVQALWKVEGADMRFEGVEKGLELRVAIEAIPDLRAVYAKVDPEARWRIDELLDPARMPDGALARLWLDGFVRIDSMDFDGTGALAAHDALKNAVLDKRTFIPGQHTQVAHSVIRCTAIFREAALDKPTLVLTDLDTKKERKLPFEDTTDVDLTFSNLCTCVGTDPASATVVLADEIPNNLVVDDTEFACYYELLDDPPDMSRRPLPFVPKGGVGALTVTQCVPTARLEP